jgi:RHS repeat-associated protein
VAEGLFHNAGVLRLRGGHVTAAEHADGYGTDVQVYDRGGDVVFSKTVQQGSPNAAAGLRDHAYFYGGDGMLHAAESRVVDDRRIDNSNYRRSFEEYRYDALGRRVWVRARRECHQAFSGYCELGWVRRTVWDGDRELYEIQAPSSGEVPYDNDRQEYDTAPVSMELRDGIPGDGNVIDPNPFYGRVAYTYGYGIDQPVSVVRMAYADMRDTLGNVGYVLRDPFAIVPLWNSRGQPALGAFADGTWRRCTGARCVKLTWPELWAGYARPQVVRDFWHGTLLQDKQDGSGLHYRRNRYYDPATGRFTQEDPIGLVGGLNLYGFSEGDPVSYSDPFGLKVCYRGSAAEVSRLRAATEEATGAAVYLDSENCISGVGLSMNSGLRGLRNRLALLSSVDDRYYVYFNRGFFDSNAEVLSGTGEVESAARTNIDCPGTVCPRNIEIGSRWAVRYQSTVIFGRCMPWGSTRPTLGQIIAHELLGHGFEYYAYTPDANRRLSEMHTVRSVDNVYNSAMGRPQRCAH